MHHACSFLPCLAAGGNAQPQRRQTLIINLRSACTKLTIIPYAPLSPRAASRPDPPVDRQASRADLRRLTDEHVTCFFVLRIHLDNEVTRAPSFTLHDLPSQVANLLTITATPLGKSLRSSHLLRRTSSTGPSPAGLSRDVCCLLNIRSPQSHVQDGRAPDGALDILAESHVQEMPHGTPRRQTISRSSTAPRRTVDAWQLSLQTRCLLPSIS